MVHISPAASLNLSNGKLRPRAYASGVPRKPRSDGYHHGDLRRALVVAARKLIAKEGHAGVSLRHVARAVGVTHPAAYHHFSDRDSLLAAVAEDGFIAMTAALLRALSGDEDAESRLTTLGRTYVTYALAHRHIYRLMFSVDLGGPDEHLGLKSARTAMFDVLRTELEAAQRAGLVRPGDGKLQALAAWSTAHGIVSLVFDGQLDATLLDDRPQPEIVGSILDTTFEGLRLR
jgi:AcrR family transcriptional regulator